jgi:hypothetical protein
MPSGPQRLTFRFPRRGSGFLGEDNREGPTDEMFAQGMLTKCRNYHLIGRGRLRKRQGSKAHISTQVNGANVIQGIAQYDFGGTRELIVVAGGKVYQDVSGVWTDITGAASLGSGADNMMRFTLFQQGGVKYLVCTGPDGANLWKWNGSGNIEVITSQGAARPPAYATDIAQFRGRVFAIGTDDDDGEMATRYSDVGRLDQWSDENLFYCDRSSPGIGLARHNRGNLLVFHRDSIHRIFFDYNSGEIFATQPVDESIGAASTQSICSSKGVTYFLSDEGPYRVKSATSPAEYIGQGLEDFWADLNKDRIQYTHAIVRGEPWNEVVWHVSTGSNTEHDASIVYNTVLGTWTIFNSPSSIESRYNVGYDYINSAGKHITLMGDYNGIVWQAWGDEDYSTGNLDGGDSGAAVRTELQTGFLDMGYPGLKRTREFWLDAYIPSERQFQFSLKGLSDSPSSTQTVSMGAGGDKLSVDFRFGISVFASINPQHSIIKKSAKARLFQFGLTESSTGPPHTLNNITATFRQLGIRMRPINQR